MHITPSKLRLIDEESLNLTRDGETLVVMLNESLDNKAKGEKYVRGDEREVTSDDIFFGE